MRSKAMFLMAVIMCTAVFICSGCGGGNYADKIISPQITAVVGPDPIITTISRSIPMSDITMYFASRGGAEFIGARKIVIYDPTAVTGDFGGIIGDRMAWAVFMKAKDSNLIITIPSDADYHVCIDDQCITIKKEID